MKKSISRDAAKRGEKERSDSSSVFKGKSAKGVAPKEGSTRIKAMKKRDSKERENKEHSNTGESHRGDFIKEERIEGENRKIRQAGYKRSDGKYEKSSKGKNRSNPRCEYNLDDAEQIEKELILNGTISDRLTCLALLCARNPSEQNYKQLLQFCENQRNDIFYATLKYVRDLIKENSNVSPYIRSRIIKSFEMGTKNQYIKDKVVEIIGVLARADIYSEEFTSILVSRLIEKGETLKLVEEALKSLYAAHSQQIFSGIEDFYYKNDTFRCQYGVLKFLHTLETRESREVFSFYDQALATLDDYPQDQRELMVELLVSGLSKTVSQGDTVASIDLVRGYVKSARSIISVLNLLMKIEDPFTESYVLRVSRTTLLRNTKHEPEFLNMIYRLKNKDLFAKMLDNSFYFSIQSILALLLMANEKRVEISRMFCLHVFIMHYHPLVRDIAGKMLREERIPSFDPFDRVYVEGFSNMLGNKTS